MGRVTTFAAIALMVSCAPLAPANELKFVVPERMCGVFGVWVKMFSSIGDPDSQLQIISQDKPDAHVRAYVSAYNYSKELEGSHEDKEVQARVLCLLAHRQSDDNPIYDI